MLPNELIELALKDLESVEADEQYSVDMATWHTPSENVCWVCLAGAVAAKSFGVSPTEKWLPDPKRDSWLVALDYFRTGEVWAALRKMGWSDPPQDMERYIVPYQDDRDQFFKDMRQLARDLKERGL